MKQIEEFSRRGLRDNEELAYNREVEHAILVETTEKLAIGDKFTVYQDKVNKFDDAIVYIAGNPITLQMQEMDAKRDNLLAGLAEQIRTATRHFEPLKKAAAEALKPVEKTFRGIQRKGFDEESGYVDNLVQKYREEPYKTHIATLGLTSWVDKLAATNVDCIELTRDRTLKDTERVVGQAREARKELDAAYNELVRMLNALALVKGDENYAALFDYINGRIAHYRSVIARRKGGGDDENSGGGEVIE